MRFLKKIFKMILLLICCIILIFLVYVVYLQVDYSRIELETTIEISNNQTNVINYNQNYEITTFNIGFGAHNQEFSFFMDKGEMLDGTKTKGKYGKGKSKDIVLNNTTSIISDAQNLNSDFYLLQEVDTSSTRSYQINQKQMFETLFNNYSSTYAVNFHSSYLAYPLFDFHGKSNSGLLTLSKYKINSSTRYKLPIDNSFPNKFFDLDRCISVSKYSIGNKELVIINVHLSAYDEGGKIRKNQLDFLNIVLGNEFNNNNYVIIGGDFNQDLIDNLEFFSSDQKVPKWINSLTNENLANGYAIVAANNAPTVRAIDIPYIKDGVKTNPYKAVIDGFIVSSNITINDIRVVDLDFKNSDHNPVSLNFKIDI